MKMMKTVKILNFIVTLKMTPFSTVGNVSQRFEAWPMLIQLRFQPGLGRVNSCGTMVN